MLPCCQENLVIVSQVIESQTTRTVKQCTVCGRRHYELEADAGEFLGLMQGMVKPTEEEDK